MCFPIMAIFFFFEPFFDTGVPAETISCIFLLVNWKVYLNLGYGLFCSTGSSVSYVLWHDQGAQAVLVASPACWLWSNAMRALCCLCCCSTPPSARTLGRAQFLLRTSSSILKMLHWELRVVQAVPCEHGFCFWAAPAPPYRLHGWGARQLFSTSLQR